MPRAVSPQKRLANRLNAQRSTGPQSAPGKRRVSLNATSHGLSSALSPNLVRERYPQLLELLTGEGIDEQTAIELALKIVDYERNEAHTTRAFAAAQSELTPQGMVHAADLDDAHGDGPQDTLALARRALELIPASALKLRPGAAQEERETLAELRLDRSLLKALVRIQGRQEAEQQDATQRYLKRASNQLIKAIKDLGARPGSA